MKKETHDNFVSEAVCTAESGYPDLNGYFDDLLNMVEIAAISGHDQAQWKEYPENKPENKGPYIVMLKLKGTVKGKYLVERDWWDGENWTTYKNLYPCIAFRPLPAPYQKVVKE